MKHRIILAVAAACAYAAADECFDYAGRELETYAEKMTGKALPEGRIELKLDPSLGEEEFRLKEDDGRLIISGGRPPGVLYGVYEYLEKYCGMRWYTRWHEKVPVLKTLPVPKGLDDRQKPAFAMRTALWYDACLDGDFAARNKMNGDEMNPAARHGGNRYRFGKGLGKCHTWPTLLPPEKYFAGHPEYFARWEGERTMSEICLSNPEVLAIVTSNVLARIREDPSAKYYGVSQNDTEVHCTCDKCAAINAYEESDAGTVIRFVNAIAETVEKEFPAAVIETLAYRYSSKPPKHVRVRKNVMPCFCTFKCEFSKPLGTSPYPANRAIARDLSGWKKMCHTLYVWDYTTDFRNYLFPFPNVFVMRENCRFFRDNGVVCLYEQGGCQGRHASFAELKAWLLAKWLWNPDLPAAPLIDDFMKGYYGKAAPYVREYFEALEALAPKIDSLKEPLRINVEPWSPFVTDAFLVRGEALWKTAKEAVKDDPVYSYNVRMSALMIDYTLARRGISKTKTVRLATHPAPAADREKTVGHIKTLRAAMAEVKAKGEGDIRLSNGGGHNDKRIQRDFDRYLAGELPVFEGKDSVVAEESVIHITDETCGVVVDDPLAADGQALRITSYDWCADFPMIEFDYDPGTEYTIRVRVRVEKTPGVKGNAFWMGIYDKETEASVSQIVKTADETGDGYAWYDAATWRPAPRQWLWIGAGLYEKESAVKAVYVDQIQIIRSR